MTMATHSGGYRSRAPRPITTVVDEEYDYDAQDQDVPPEEEAYQEQYEDEEEELPPPPPPPLKEQPGNELHSLEEEDVHGDDALLDLVQLEELHQEAEKMKALGNKHMAAQEYTRAYNAYSAALQLSPVGPSSHVFLSNRAASLLSMKKYAAAATDARRAVALAPTFGKAHARLGQSLYFLKDYEGAVASYQEAVQYEPENEVTRTYLEKARNKLIRQREKAAKQARGEETSLAEESMPVTVANSIATDPQKGAAVVTSGFRGSSKVIMNAVASREMPSEVTASGFSTPITPLTPLTPSEKFEFNDDPDFDEAVRIQKRANRYLSLKQYKSAIEEYSAALFLVPDDPYLSPDLHLGRAHALNGSRRHESACNDAQLAVKIRPTPEAFSTLAKSKFYMKEYLEAIEAFEHCMELLPRGDSLSMFDQAYLRKSQAAYRAEIENFDSRSVTTTRSSKSVVPRLPPPRFVPREQAINSTPNIPAMPKNWPQQSPHSPTALQVGPERPVTFLSESLGIKLNRGADGVVRVLAVTPESPGSPIARNGRIRVGDVVREAAGVDIRRPITNIMWGDTVALIKMAPRPITLVVAKELSEAPASVLEERMKHSPKVPISSMSPASISISLGEQKEEEQ